ncbi:MAG: hypothetical protein KDH09_14930 [Chrysiogenetes bacterium]|nr:hypothetical protein [Chrysiogenetes bacterium]
MRFRTSLLTLALLFSVSGCGYFAKWPAQAEALASLNEILSAEPEADSFWGDGWVRLENARDSVVFAAEFVVEYPDKFRMTAFGLFDKPEAYLASDGRRIALYLVGENRYFSGPARGEALATILGLPPMEMKELLGYLTGQIPVSDTTGADLAADKWKGRWTASVGPITSEEKIRFPRTGGRIEGFARTAPGRRVDVRFSNFSVPDEGSARPYPHRIAVSAPEAQALFRVSFREMEINAPVESRSIFTLRAPPGAIHLPFTHAAGLMGLPLPPVNEPAEELAPVQD